MINVEPRCPTSGWQTLCLQTCNVFEISKLNSIIHLHSEFLGFHNVGISKISNFIMARILCEIWQSVDNNLAQLVTERHAEIVVCRIEYTRIFFEQALFDVQKKLDFLVLMVLNRLVCYHKYIHFNLWSIAFLPNLYLLWTINVN